MRKVFLCGSCLVAAVAIYWAGAYAGGHPDSLLGQCTALLCPLSCGEESGGDCGGSVDEPVACDETNVNHGTSIEPEPPEPINLLSAEIPALQKDECCQQGTLPALVPSIPALIDGEQDGCGMMPRCDDEESDVPATMPYATDGKAISGSGCLEGLNEESEISQPDKRKAEPKLDSEKEKVSPPKPLPRQTSGATHPHCDTMEFRPGDAKRGEFDAISF